ncbi:MAG: hypothetical protein IT437_06550 [Phycisphaerales bacterium]|nr:hypothetical protein [Phycisphaerales bacterium]
MSDNHTGGEGALLSWLAGNDAPCPVCSYNLRGLKEPRCPECAAPLHLAVGSTHFVTGPWVLALVALSLAMGFDGVVLVLMTVGGTIGWIAEGPPPPGFLWVIGSIYAGFTVLASVCGLGVWLLLRGRRAWLSQTPRRQWRVAVGLFAGVGVVHLLYGLAVVTYMQRL